LGARSYLLLWLASAVAIGAAAALFSQPGYMDAYYYYHVAANLAAGRGLVEDLVWNYLGPVDGIPHPSNFYWMPLTSLVAAPFLAIFGPGFRAAQAPLVFVASLVPVVAAAVVWDLWRDRWLALAAAALTLFGGFYFFYWAAIDSFGIYALAATAALWAIARFLRQEEPSASQPPASSYRSPWLLGALAGLGAGAAHLARADGFLLLAAIAGVFLLRRRRGWLAAGVAAVVAYFLVMGPWFLRMMSQSGGILPPGSGATVFLREYNELFSFSQAHSLDSYLSWGIGPILLSKLRAFAENLVALYGAGFMLLPFGLLGVAQMRRDRRLLPFFLYTALLYVFLTLLFTFPGARGSMRHSAVVFLPWSALLAMQGVRVAVRWAALRLPHWNVERAQRGFTLVALGASAALSLSFLVYNAGSWDEELLRYQEVAGWLEQQAAGPSPVMVTDPPGFWYASGRPGVVTPSDGPDALVAAADRYNVEYIALEAAHAPVLHPLYFGTQTPARLEPVAWVGTTRMFKVLR